MERVHSGTARSRVGHRYAIGAGVEAADRVGGQVLVTPLVGSTYKCGRQRDRTVVEIIERLLVGVDYGSRQLSYRGPAHHRVAVGSRDGHVVVRAAGSQVADRYSVGRERLRTAARPVYLEWACCPCRYRNADTTVVAAGVKLQK